MISYFEGIECGRNQYSHKLYEIVKLESILKVFIVNCSKSGKFKAQLISKNGTLSATNAM